MKAYAVNHFNWKLSSPSRAAASPERSRRGGRAHKLPLQLGKPESKDLGFVLRSTGLISTAFPRPPSREIQHLTFCWLSVSRTGTAPVRIIEVAAMLSKCANPL